MAPLRIAELFAGIGGVTGGLLDAGGFMPVALVDSDPLAARAFRTNYPEHAARYHVRSVRGRLTSGVLLELAGGHIDGILGCPPCQGLSQAGARDANDERNQLVHEMRRLVRGVRPFFSSWRTSQASSARLSTPSLSVCSRRIMRFVLKR